MTYTLKCPTCETVTMKAIYTMTCAICEHYLGNYIGGIRGEGICKFDGEKHREGCILVVCFTCGKLVQQKNNDWYNEETGEYE